ncbi:carbohydrate porin [Methylopila turkensis]|uniref:Porin n=1 Tax=Methylopila turkensis TaxID=1437816 RepID=A0A9W6N872_9HYPH|nr:carbohydrate porin [Methylopila turkensis]GLK81116.1 porin [Methylopila turkensis]
MSRLKNSGALVALTGALALSAGLAGHAIAADAPADAEGASSFWADLFTREKLTGDWGGARTKLEDAGVTFEASFTGDATRNVSGGLSRGGGFTGLFQFALDFDLEKIAGWEGAEIHAGAYVITGHGLSTYRIGNLLAVSGAEADNLTRLAEVYFKQTLLDGRFVFKIGQLAADGDFVTSDTAGLFVNSAFGWPGLNGVDLPGGGPAYPVPTPGVHVAYAVNDQLSFQAGLYSGDPLDDDGKNNGGVTFTVDRGVFVIAEAAYATDAVGGLPGVYKVGGWYNSNDFDDLRFARNGLSLADPGADDPKRRDGSYALYGVIDQTVWKAGEGEQALSVFARAVIAPQSNRNLIDYYFDAGFNLKAPFAGRDNDVFGVAVAYAHISDRARKLDRDAIRLGSAGPVRSSELAIEASYQAEVAPWLKAQPFAQYIVRPGGGDPHPDHPNRRIRNATVLGLRTTVDF